MRTYAKTWFLLGIWGLENPNYCYLGRQSQKRSMNWQHAVQIGFFMPFDRSIDLNLLATVGEKINCGLKLWHPPNPSKALN